MVMEGKRERGEGWRGREGVKYSKKFYKFYAY